MNIFETIKNEIKSKFSDLEYKIWLADIDFVSYRERVLRLSTSSLFKKEKIEKKYLESILKIAQDRFNDLKIIEIEHSKPTKNDPPEAQKASKENTPRPLLEKAIKNNGPNVIGENNFKNYLVYEENQLAFDFAQKVISKIGYINPLLIFGKVGVGKTHLIQAIYNEISKRFPFYALKYVNPNDFVSEYTNALKHKRDRNFRINYRSLDVLFIDDIQFFIGKEKSTQEFFDIFNSIFTHKRQMIFCSDREPDKLDRVDERLKSRLSSSVILELKEPSLDSRKKLIFFFNQLYNTKLSLEVIDFLSHNLESDVRKIKGALKSLLFFKEMYKKTIDVDFCLNHLKHLIKNKEEKRSSTQKILKELAKVTNMSLETIKSNNKNKKIVLIRQIAMFLIKRHTQNPLKEIGRELGGKSPAAVLYSINHIKKNKDHNLNIDNIITKTMGGL